jgi:hypothetical protein
MRRLPIASFCNTRRVSRADGAALRREIEASWQAGESISLDFTNVRIASVSFFDEAIGLLAREHSLEDLKVRVLVENLNPSDRALLNNIVASRSRERATDRHDSTAPAR